MNRSRIRTYIAPITASLLITTQQIAFASFDPRTFDINPDTYSVAPGVTFSKITLTDVFGHPVDMEHSNLAIK